MLGDVFFESGAWFFPCAMIERSHVREKKKKSNGFQSGLDLQSKRRTVDLRGYLFFFLNT